VAPPVPMTAPNGAVVAWGERVRLPEAPQLGGSQRRDPILPTERVPPQRPLSQTRLTQPISGVSLRAVTTSEP